MEAALSQLPYPGLSGLPLALSPGHYQALAGSITESMPPEIPARTSLTLPPDIDQFPFSSFISTNFQVGPQTSAPPGTLPRLPQILALPGRSCARSFFPCRLSSPVMGVMGAATLLGE